MSPFTKTIPASWYYDPHIYEMERKSIFSSEWIYIGEENDFKNSGDYIKYEMAGYPLFLVKGEDNLIRGFHNVCIHRAAPLVSEKKGNLKNSSVTCRYHGWTYDLKGTLNHTPFLETSDVKKNCQGSLFEVKLAQFNGLIFINLNENPIDFNEFINPLDHELNHAKYNFNEYTNYESMEHEGNFNWKTWQDGFQECYHCMTIHPIFNKNFQLRKYNIENKDRYSVHSCERKDITSSFGEFEGLWLWHYPNLGLPCYQNCFYTLQVNPINSRKTKLSYRFRFKSHVNEIERKEFIKTIEKITFEDIMICEQVQKNLEVGIYNEGILHPERENGVEYFHSLIKKALADQNKGIHYGKNTI
ncbi:aromatic ring-hydroxylating oxygenase subunit alpha [Silvanigrella aquatica]|uniref:Rieske domain-containing protein n=1 Tax=Silvanigrella aquatica TaxID=1915309 RepID=A0A1L4D3J0_9BACT|nr:aromatic ring-hydroxylating dioxygenase subunit alpha [Silvanigrella aquatica]APJ04773.1 hypothetical protein AXG55_13045 [Silvanigrella aquatica]